MSALDLVLALLDRLECAEAYSKSVALQVLRDTKAAHAGEAGEIVDAVLRECGACIDDVTGPGADAALLIVQRALDAAEERGAETEREQRAIERRHGVER